MLVFRAVSTDELRSMARGAKLPGPAWAATSAFLETFSLASGDDEDAERTLLYVAGLAALLSHGRRLVVVAQAPATATGGGDDAFGAVEIDPIGFGQVSALFADAADSARLADSARTSLAGLALEDAWDHPSHQALLNHADLLWYGPEEWAVLTGDAVAE